MVMPERKYDVAFSFRQADLSLAERLADLIQPLTSFVYARKQGEIATKDGMETFGRVFGSESRLNVVLYRKGYGEAGWTVFEKDTITGRCLKGDGWTSFALFIIDGSQAPSWVPSTYIYGDLSVMEADVLAGVIRYRAREVGANVRRESAEDRIRHLAASEEFDRETDRLATSREAFDAIEENRRQIFSWIAETIQRVATPRLPGQAGAQGFNQFAANLGHIGTYLNYRNPYGRVTGGQMTIRLFNGPVVMPGDAMIGHPSEIVQYSADVIRTRTLQWCWSFQGKARTSHELAEFVLNELARLNSETEPAHFIDRL